MATVASQLILHPVVSQSLKILSTTVGRDKVRGESHRSYLWFMALPRSSGRSNTLQGSTPGFSFLQTVEQMPQNGTPSNPTLHLGANVRYVPTIYSAANR